jgi:hypothetical protein
MTPHRDWNECRDRQRKELDGRRRRRQHNEIKRRRRQEIDGKRGRRRESVCRIGEDQRGRLDIGQFLGGRRRHVIVDRCERCRRVGSKGAQREPPPAIGAVRAVRVSPQVGPIGVRRVRRKGRPPGEGLAPRRDNGPHPLGHGIVGIGGQKFLVAFQRVALDGSQVRVRRGKVAQRPRADCRHLFG